MIVIKNAGLAEEGELEGRERRTRNIGGEEIRRKWTRFRYFGVRIAHRWSRVSDLPHDSFFSSDESFHSHGRTAALTRVKIIDPPAARENVQYIAWLQSEHTGWDYPFQRIERSRTESPLRVKIIFLLFLFWEKYRDEYSRAIAISNNRKFSITQILRLWSIYVDVHQTKIFLLKLSPRLKLIILLITTGITRYCVFTELLF